MTPVKISTSSKVKFLITFFTAQIALATFHYAEALAHGGVTVGNGGSTVVCKDRQSKIVRAELFDLYEGRVLKGLSYQENTRPYLDQARDIIAALAMNLQQHADTDGGVIDLLERNIKHLIFLPSGTGLKTAPDGAEFILPKGCELQQAANFHDLDHIYIDSDIWSELSNTQKAALLVHETVYEYLRDPGSKGSVVELNSIRSRRVVALLFSGQKFSPLENFDLKKGFKPQRCVTEDALEADRPSSFFYAYPSQNESGQDQLTFQFIQLADRHLLTKTRLVTAPIETSAFPKAPKGRTYYASGKLDSLVDPDGYVSVTIWPESPSHNSIFIRDVDGNTYNETFVCRY